MHNLAFYLSENLLLTYVTTALIGLLIGSFLNVVIYRLPKMMEAEWREQCEELLCVTGENPSEQKNNPTFNLATPRSRCPHCNHLISAIENVPVISYLFLKGKCRKCRASISARYPIIELVTALLSVLVVCRFGVTLTTLAALLLTWSLISLTMIDIDTQLLPDSITLPLVWLGLIANYFQLFTSFESAFWGAIAGYLILWSVFWLFKLITGKEGMGYGDFKLLAALGAFLGWEYLLQIILLSTLVGAVVGISLILFKKHGKEVPIPFGPYLAAAGFIALIWGGEINAHYLAIAFPAL